MLFHDKDETGNFVLFPEKEEGVLEDKTHWEIGNA